MKGSWKLLLLTALATLAPLQAGAQVEGQYMGAQVVPLNGHLFGAYVQISKDFLGLSGQLRLSFFPDMDFGFQGGLTRVEVGGDDFTTLRIGGDLRYQIVKAAPFDISAGGALGVETGDNISVLTVGPTMVVSRTFPVGSGAFVPYAGVGLLFSNADVLDHEDTDFSLPFRLGTELQLSPEIRLVGEFQLRASDELNDDISFVTGVNLPF